MEILMMMRVMIGVRLKTLFNRFVNRCNDVYKLSIEQLLKFVV